MNNAIQIPATIGELLGDPQRVRDALELLNALAALEVHLVVSGGAVELGPGKAAIKGAPPTLVLPLPLKFATPIADSTATAFSVSTQLNLLLAALRTNGQNPS